MRHLGTSTVFDVSTCDDGDTMEEDVTRDHTQLIQDLSTEYERRFPRSAALDRRASAVMVDGGSHAVRLNRPFPPRIAVAAGAYVTDVDGHALLDFWQGHFANILGHTPAVVTQRPGGGARRRPRPADGHHRRAAGRDRRAALRRRARRELRFTTSGSLATMYAILLARAFTGRELVLKVAGGWHGAQPWGLKGVYFLPGPSPGRGERGPAGARRRRGRRLALQRPGRARRAVPPARRPRSPA